MFYGKYADLKVKIRQLEFEMEAISENVADLRRQIKEKECLHIHVTGKGG